MQDFFELSTHWALESGGDYFIRASGLGTVVVLPMELVVWRRGRDDELWRICPGGLQSLFYVPGGFMDMQCLTCLI